jgi:putative ABC transport system ATP-binding protein
VDLEVWPSELLVVQGRSGSGKTTLLNLMGGLDRPTVGTVLFDGLDLTIASEAELTDLRRHKVGFVFQLSGLLPLLSAYENVELPLRINGVPRQERRRRAQESLDQVGLAERAKHRPYELSGGEQQRVAIARALTVRPAVLLADEPTGDLDSAIGLSIATLLKEVAQQQSVTVVVATHDLALEGMADRVARLVDGALVQKTGGGPASGGGPEPGA